MDKARNPEAERPVRRPEVEAAAKRLHAKNPSWTMERCIAEAKQRWTADQAFKRSIGK